MKSKTLSTKQRIYQERVNKEPEPVRFKDNILRCVKLIGLRLRPAFNSHLP